MNMLLLYGKRNNAARVVGVAPFCEYEPRMVAYIQMKIIGISVFSLMLLPLALSCDSNRTMREIAEDYETVIYPLLQNLENNITESLKVINKTCTEKEIAECEKDKERQFIHNMLCSHTRLIRLYKLERLKRDILCSLGRHCPRKQRSPQGQSAQHQKRKKESGEEREEENEKTEENRRTTEEGGERVDSGKQQRRDKGEGRRSTEAMERRRRRCGQKVFVDSLKGCYMSLAERYGGLT
uniref:Interleukin-7 n=1 Tax=Hucho hucho TaxID=62062 RepID=A0A4W5L8R4_9TELE